MVINCLPLFIPRSNTLEVESAAAACASGDSGAPGDKGKAREKVQTQDIHNSMHEGRRKARQGTKAARRFVLKKASSSDNLLAPVSAPPLKPDTLKRSSEAEDILDEAMRSKVEVHRDRWTHFNSSYKKAVDPTSEVESDNLLQKAVETVEPQQIKEGVGYEGEKGIVEDMGKNVGGECVSEGEVAKEGEERGGNEPSQVLSDGGSDGEGEREMRISYIENPEQVQTLKRSSGSVSFFGGAAPTVRKMANVSSPPPPRVSEDGEEMGDEASTSTRDAEEGASGSGVTVVLEGVGGDKVTCVGDEGAKDMCTGCESGEGSDVVFVGGKGQDKVNGGGARKQNSEKAEVESGQNMTPEPAPSDSNHAEEETPSENVALTQTTPSQMPSGPATPDPPQLTPSSPPPQGTAEEPQGPQVTPLPPAPLTVEPEFIERSGWLTKLSHRRGQ